MRKRWIIALGILLVLVALGYLVFPRGAAATRDYRFDKVSRGDILMTVTATGTINAVISVDVGTQVSGIISKLYADFNSVVKEGQVIAQIDSTFLVQAVNDAEASLARAQAQLADSKRTLDREKALVEKALDTQANLDAAQTTYESNDAAEKQAEASLQRAKINLAYSTIYAPIDGVVIDRKVNVGQTVAASFSSPTLYTIVNDLRNMQVLATIGEVDIGSISVGQEATFTVDAYPDETFKGTVSQIRLAPVTVQNVVNYTVVIDVSNDQLKLMPGMTANVSILVASARDALRVPNMALRFQPPSELVDTMRTGGGSPATAGADSSRPSRGFGRGHFRSERRGDSTGAPTAEGAPPQATVPARAPVAKGTTYGIINTFPEFEKTPYVPLHQSGRARVWVVNARGKLTPLYVLTGITDGRYTETTSPDLKPGDSVVLGILNSTTATTQTRSPLTGGSQQRPGGGFPGGGGPR